MNGFEPEYFRKVKFSEAQVRAFLKNAFRDLDIASKDAFPEVRFMFAYQALVKAGIAYLAKSGVKARAVPGHHLKTLDKLGELLKDPDVSTLGNAMRMKRNEDLYGDGGFISEKEADEYLEFVRSVLSKVKKALGHGL